MAMFRWLMAGVTGLGRWRARRRPPPAPPPPLAGLAGQYDQVVSLGKGCQPAHQIRRLLGTTSAHVFDWIVTTDGGLVAHIASGLDGFFALDRLGPAPGGVIADVATGTQFIHEFPKGREVRAQHAEHAARFAMLAARWRALLRSDQRVLFVRMHMDDDAPRASAERLRDAIAGRAPRLRFTILYLTDDPADEVGWGMAGIVNRHLKQPEPYAWEGDDAAWEALLRQALAVPPAGATSPSMPAATPDRAPAAPATSP
jgi:hypothetical protein